MPLSNLKGINRAILFYRHIRDEPRAANFLGWQILKLTHIIFWDFFLPVRVEGGGQRSVKKTWNRGGLEKVDFHRDIICGWPLNFETISNITNKQGNLDHFSVLMFEPREPKDWFI